MNPLQPVDLGTTRPGPLTGPTAPLEQQQTTKVQQVKRRGKYADMTKKELGDEARTLQARWDSLHENKHKYDQKEIDQRTDELVQHTRDFSKRQSELKIDTRHLPFVLRRFGKHDHVPTDAELQQRFNQLFPQSARTNATEDDEKTLPTDNKGRNIFPKTGPVEC